MANFLITGAAGFVAKHYIHYIMQNEVEYTILLIDKNDINIDYTNDNVSFAKVDLTDKEKIIELLNDFKPDYLLHLASISSVSHSWNNPVESFVNNTNIFLNLVDSIRLLKINTKIISVGSSEEYGGSDKIYLPFDENTPIIPKSPYAVARVSQEMLSNLYFEGYGVNIITTRSFNHFGPGQNENFVIPSLIKKILLAKQNNQKSILTGNLNIKRDFVDVRDVVEAYHLLFKKGKIGNTYNICSSISYSLLEVAQKICEIIGYKVNFEVDGSLLRPMDALNIVGNKNKIFFETGWTPKISIVKSLTDTLIYLKKT